MEIFFRNPYLTLAITALSLNIACGYFREKTTKFTLNWWLWIHASIPVLIYLRNIFHTVKIFIPVCIILAILGQIIGGRLRRLLMTEKDFEKLFQIPNLRLRNQDNLAIEEEDVMVVLLNMGGPKTNQDVPDFLKRIFLDSHIIRFPLSRILQPFFAWLLVSLRAVKTQERYQLIGCGSPIYESTLHQLNALNDELLRRNRKLSVTFSFNYSQPFPEDTIKEIKLAKKKYILPLSLYPHFSEATTGSNIYYLKKAAKKNFPQLKFLDIPSYYLNNSYIQALVEKIYEQINPEEALNDFYLIFSAHGLPQYFLNKGDPYPFQVAQTVARILEKLNRQAEWVIAYQSEVGPLAWLKPSIENIIKELAKKGVKKILIIPVSFVSDHIETLCEIDIEYRKLARDCGIIDFRMSRAIESHPGFIQALADSVEHMLPRKIKNQDHLKNGIKELESIMD